MTDLEMIDEMRNRFGAVVDEINKLSIAQDPKFEVDYTSLGSFDSLYNRVKRTRNKINTANSVPAVQLPARSDNKSDTKNVFKLPAIEFPAFDGKMENWPVFYESFKANIHDNKNLSNSQRVQYLMGKLTHNALKVTAGTVPTGETYSIIWNGLVKIYQDKRALGTHYLNGILNLKACSLSANSLNTFVESYAAAFSALKGQEIPDLTDFILLNCALRKLDLQTTQAFEMSVREEEIL